MRCKTVYGLQFHLLIEITKKVLFRPTQDNLIIYPSGIWGASDISSNQRIGNTETIIVDCIIIFYFFYLHQIH
jgi:hypothetical protein